MRKIYILTNFSVYLKSFSPIIVVASQLRMLLDHGIEPILIATEGWNPPEDSVFNSVRTVLLPRVPVSNGAGKDATFDADVEVLTKTFLANADPNEEAIVITHDLIFLPDYVKHHIAAKAASVMLPNVKWVHWVHSATSPHQLIQEREMYGDTYKQILTEKFPNSMVAFPNAEDIPRVAKNFGYELDEVFEVPHCSDPIEGMHPVVKRLYKECELWKPEILMVYPLRMDRGKQPHMNAHFIAACKRAGVSAKLVFCDFQSTGGDKVAYREEIEAFARENNIARDVIFTSQFEKSAEMELPHSAILDLFTLSNIFMLPSQSETYSLVAQEAMMRGNLCLLNRDFAPMRQIYGQNALYYQFSGNVGIDGFDGAINTTYNPTIEAYFDNMVNNVRAWLVRDRMLRAKTWVRTERSPEAVFENYFYPLLGASNEQL
jgi:glycosyltransferase involved in cell wall biosynthesis